MHIIWKYALRYKKLLFVALGLATINQLFSLLDPQLFRILVDSYATNVDAYTQAEFVRGAGLLLLGIVGVALVSRTAKAFQDYFVNVVTQSIGTNMYADSVRHVFDLSYEVFEDERSGSILLNLQKARDDTRNFITQVINVIFLSAIGIIFVVVYSFFVHWAIAVTFLLLIPIVSSATYVLSKRIERAQQEIVAESADLSGATTETLRNVGLVKSLGLENQEVERLNNTNDRVLDLEIKKVMLVRRLTFIQGTMVNAVRVLILFVTVYLLYLSQITLGEFMIFTYYTFYVFGPLYGLSDVVSQYQQAKASTAELSRILSLSTSAYGTGGQVLEDINRIKLQQVSYTYRTSTDPSVQNISFTLERGKTVALVGPSGSGKSTIVKLLVGLYKPTHGSFLINGQPVESIDFDSYRNRIGLVTQETQLFSGTIRENLTFVKPKATDEECTRALKNAAAEYLLQRGDAQTGIGLDARIGETGIKLSGGERQRLAIARALLRDPNILIFDEATSALDSLTENAITETIRKIRERNPELMMLVIAHRLSTITHADTIHVLKNGEEVERGSHHELLGYDGLYRALWRQQTT